MFNHIEVHRILVECCQQLRKGAEIVERNSGAIGVVEIYAMPAATDDMYADWEKVDCHFVTVAVNKEKAEAERANFIEQLDQWPQPEALKGGPSYMAIGGELGDQGAALEFFALGEVLGLWKTITPLTFGMTGAQADQAAGAGYVMCTGYPRENASVIID